jgi:predicted ATPase
VCFLATTIDGAISRIKISGYKSIKDIDLALDNLNILIGANGSGKSNFISFFQLLKYYLSKDDGLSEFVGKNGGANSLLYMGANKTKTIEAAVTFDTNTGKNTYEVEMGFQKGDRLYFKDERVNFQPNKKNYQRPPTPLGGGGSSSRLLQISKEDDGFSEHEIKRIHVIRTIMKKWEFYQFHNTASETFIRGASHKDDIIYFRSDGGNLAAFLFMLKDRFPNIYSSIINTLKQVAPYVDDFSVDPEYASPYVRFKWSEKPCKNYFLEASQMSDGTLRALALITLLMLPQKPSIICIDEPELGLHPEAICIIADLMKVASEKSQIIVSTQSPKLIDCFEPENIVVVDSKHEGTKLNRLDYEKYKLWFEDYSISETWDTNVFGGKP